MSNICHWTWIYLILTWYQWNVMSEENYNRNRRTSSSSAGNAIRTRQPLFVSQVNRTQMFLGSGSLPSQSSRSLCDVIAGPRHTDEGGSWFPLQIRTRTSGHSLTSLYVYDCLKRTPTVDLSYLTRPSLELQACDTDRRNVDLNCWRRAINNPVDS